MNSSFHILFLAVLFLNNGLQAADVPLAEMQQQQHHLKNIHSIKDIKDFILKNPNFRLIRLHKNTPHHHPSQSVKYALGDRVTGDHMLVQYADTFYYSSPQNVSTQVTFPGTSAGSIVTSVDIHCLQDNVEGNAYVVAGGIQQRFVSIVLEATLTKRFTYNIHVYGKD